jgi:hypothetical protein
VNESHEECRADDRPEDAERMAVHANDQRLREVQLACDPRPQHRADEAHDGRHEQTAARPPCDLPADGADDGRDQDE